MVLSFTVFLLYYVELVCILLSIVAYSAIICLKFSISIVR